MPAAPGTGTGHMKPNLRTPENCAMEVAVFTTDTWRQLPALTVVTCGSPVRAAGAVVVPYGVRGREEDTRAQRERARQLPALTVVACGSPVRAAGTVALTVVT